MSDETKSWLVCGLIIGFAIFAAIGAQTGDNVVKFFGLVCLALVGAYAVARYSGGV